MSEQNVEILIVGQGLAGSILAHQLIKHGKRVVVVDDDHRQSSSVVAAGIINPITGHRLNITKGFDYLYPAAKAYYMDLQIELGVELWQPISQIRLIKNSGQLDYYNKRKSQPEYADILGTVEESNQLFPNASYGAVEIAQTAVVNVAGLLHKMRSWLVDRDSIVNAEVDYQKILSTDGEFSIQNVKAAKIIFCEGHRAMQNPWLKKLPFRLSKGEVLTVDPGESLSQMLNWGNWLVPSTQGVRLGSTFAWNDLSMAPSPAVKAKLIESLRRFTGLTATSIQHRVGIRPTTAQRIPFVGPISGLDGGLCFNGFGSKGCLLIPHYAKQLCQNVLFQATLPKELTRCL